VRTNKYAGVQKRKTSKLMKPRCAHILNVKSDGVHTFKYADLKSCTNVGIQTCVGSGGAPGLTSELRNIISSGVHT